MTFTEWYESEYDEIWGAYDYLDSQYMEFFTGYEKYCEENDCEQIWDG